MKATVSNTKLGKFEYVDHKPDRRNPGVHYLIFECSNLVPGAIPRINDALESMQRVRVHDIEQTSLTVGVDVSGVKQEQAHGYLDHTAEDVLGALENAAKSFSLAPTLLAPAAPPSANHRPGYNNRPPIHRH